MAVVVVATTMAEVVAAMMTMTTVMTTMAGAIAAMAVQ